MNICWTMVYVNTDTPYMVFYTVTQLWTRDTETCESSPLWAIWQTKLPEGPLSCEQWDLCWTCNMQGKLRWRWEAKQQRAETRVENKPRTCIHRSHYHHFQGQRVCMCVLTGYGKKPWDPRIKLGTFEGGGKWSQVFSTPGSLQDQLLQYQFSSVN